MIKLVNITVQSVPCIHAEWAILGDDVPWTCRAASRKLICYWNTETGLNYCNDRLILRPNVEINCNEYFHATYFISGAHGLLKSLHNHLITTRRNGGMSLPLTLSQCTLAGPVYTGMPLECHWLTQCTLGYHWATQRILAGYTGTPLEKLSWNSPHWNATGETLTFAAYTGTPLEGLWQPTQAPTHIVKHAE